MTAFHQFYLKEETYVSNPIFPSQPVDYTFTTLRLNGQVGLGDVAKKVITVKNLISLNIDNYQDKCEIIDSIKFKGFFCSRVKVKDKQYCYKGKFYRNNFHYFFFCPAHVQVNTNKH